MAKDVDEVTDDVKRYFEENSAVWRKHRFGDFKTWAVLGDKLKGLDPESARDIFGTALGFLSSAQNEIGIYREALRKLEGDKSEQEVDEWHENLGFSVKHSRLGAALVSKISQIYQSVINVVQTFLRSVGGALQMKVTEIDFNFSASPSINVKFA